MMSDPNIIPAHISKDLRTGKVVRMVVKRLFVDDKIDLSMGIWINCHFDGCIVALRGTSFFDCCHGCSFKDCRYEGDGWPVELA